MKFERKYSYDDLLLVPQRSSVKSRSDVVLETKVTPNTSIGSPLVSAPMDSVTEFELAQSMTDNLGVGIIHRFQHIDDQVEMVSNVDGKVGASVGIGAGEQDSAFMLQEAGADFICVDIAHGHMERCVSFIEELSESIEVDIMVGNVATIDGVKDLVKAGADSIKIGVGPGSHCNTREQTGHGYPQASAIIECSENIFGVEKEYTIIADGGIKKPGDAVKALMLGADAVMMGGIFGRSYESPGNGSVWGCASENGEVDAYIEGVVTESEEKYSVEHIFDEFTDGIRSGLSYSGGHTIPEARENAEFVEISPSTKNRNGGFEI